MLLYPIITLVRKLSLIFLLIYSQNNPVLSTIFLNLQSLAMIIVVEWIKPFTSNLQHNLEIFNEICILFVNYHLLTFTDFQPNPEVRDKIGKNLVLLLVLCMIVNIGLSYYESWLVVRIKYSKKFWFLHQKLKR